MEKEFGHPRWNISIIRRYLQDGNLKKELRIGI